MQQTRKKFLTKLTAATAAVTGLSSFQQQPTEMEMENVFIHHVYFWLKNPESVADRDKLAEGLAKLSAIKTIQNFHIGKPASTKRDVIESSYALSWLVIFHNGDDEASYQTDPIHLKFIEDYSYLWSKVIVYDSEDRK